MSTSTEDSTYIIPFKVESEDGGAIDLSGATLTYELTDRSGFNEVKISKTDSDSTVYTASAEIDSELSNILSEDFGLSDSEATDLTNGRFVVEITPSEMPEAGTYYHEIRADYPTNNRSFADVVDLFTVERASST